PSYKCTLTGMQSALDINWKRLRNKLHDSKGIILRDNERLGALALIKRLAERANAVQSDKKIYSTTHIAKDDPDATEEPIGSKDVTGYLAVLHMDGDQMGKRLGDLHHYQAHQEFSGQLADFAANEVQRIVNKYGGKT